MTTASSTEVPHSAGRELPFELETLRLHIDKRKKRESSDSYPGFSLEQLIRVAQSKEGYGDIDEIETILAFPAYLEFVMGQTGWWMGTADAAMSDKHANRGEVCLVTHRQHALRTLVAELLALIPTAWQETYAHSEFSRGSATGRRLVARYLEFREAVCVAIEEIWDSYPDHSIFKEMRRLG